MTPADDTGALSTPLRADTPTHDTTTIKSTLNSRGAAVTSENIGVLGVHPFIEATNIALACLERIKVDGMGDPVPAINMTCQQNDIPMFQTHQTETSMWKPDLVLLPLNNAYSAFPAETDGKEGKQQGEKKDNQNDTAVDDEENDERCKNKCKAHLDTNATGKPTKILWKDILACLEFKRETLVGRTKWITSPPSSYTATDYVPTKLKYLLVDHLEAETPTPDPLQTPAPQPSSDTACK
ncbi:hypothetical protein CY34DRAFT_110856 [Suillus luteus UH-Slu-Lm8-n1]|uniref:Uncharacterized protein n=1 Tax=Suillus luteus UH-Slu-Lm8-n1 TaxID=930992 RepID=A0A0D0A3F0_9AGAM|nr:hypothetical protein CY34DRAFT_110856 [Suillus luteus UH-Slu-Lm8-n1]